MSILIRTMLVIFTMLFVFAGIGSAETVSREGYKSISMQAGETVGAIVLRETRNAANWRKDLVVVVNSAGVEYSKTEEQMSSLPVGTVVLVKEDAIRTTQMPVSENTTIESVCVTGFAGIEQADCISTLTVLNQYNSTAALASPKEWVANKTADKIEVTDKTEQGLCDPPKTCEVIIERSLLFPAIVLIIILIVCGWILRYRIFDGGGVKPKPTQVSAPPPITQQLREIVGSSRGAITQKITQIYHGSNTAPGRTTTLIRENPFITESEKRSPEAPTNEPVPSAPIVAENSTELSKEASEERPPDAPANEPVPSAPIVAENSTELSKEAKERRQKIPLLNDFYNTDQVEIRKTLKEILAGTSK